VPADDRPRLRPPGRPRSERARQSILAAAAELLLVDGLGATSMDAVAQRAGVSKATIYRWWPTKEALALDAIYDAWPADVGAAPDTGALRSDLLALLRPWVRRVTQRPYARIVAALLSAARNDQAFAERYVTRFVEPRREPARRLFGRAIERGEVSPDTPIESAIDMVWGPLYHRLLHGHAPLDDRFLGDVVDLALDGIARSAATPPSSR
jgi:AcrR family transcriptional regulator